MCACSKPETVATKGDTDEIKLMPQDDKAEVKKGKKRATSFTDIVAAVKRQRVGAKEEEVFDDLTDKSMSISSGPSP